MAKLILTVVFFWGFLQLRSFAPHAQGTSVVKQRLCIEGCGHEHDAKLYILPLWRTTSMGTITHVSFSVAPKFIEEFVDGLSAMPSIFASLVFTTLMHLTPLDSVSDIYILKQGAGNA